MLSKDCCFFCWLTSQQNASTPQGWVWSGNCLCCHTQTKAADQTCHLIQSVYWHRDSYPSADPVAPCAWQGSHWSTKLLSHWYTLTQKIAHGKSGDQTQVCHSRGRQHTTRPRRRCGACKRTAHMTQQCTLHRATCTPKLLSCNKDTHDTTVHTAQSNIHP